MPSIGAPLSGLEHPPLKQQQRRPAPSDAFVATATITYHQMVHGRVALVVDSPYSDLLSFVITYGNA